MNSYSHHPSIIMHTVHTSYTEFCGVADFGALELICQSDILSGQPMSADSADVQVLIFFGGQRYEIRLKCDIGIGVLRCGAFLSGPDEPGCSQILTGCSSLEGAIAGHTSHEESMCHASRGPPPEHSVERVETTGLIHLGM